jgi:uncharacterized protein YjbI with pentapeptide repeats
MKAEELKQVLEDHLKWLDGAGGRRADLTDANLTDANLTRAYLPSTNLTRANLTDVNLSGANLSGASLSDADLTDANLTRADLTRADLSGASLSDADLTDADLYGTIGNMRQVKSLQLETYPITYTKDRLQIGCKNYSFEKWQSFTDYEIQELDGDRALAFWRKWKTTIFKIVEMSPAE